MTRLPYTVSPVLMVVYVLPIQTPPSIYIYTLYYGFADIVVRGLPVACGLLVEDLGWLPQLLRCIPTANRQEAPARIINTRQLRGG